MRARRIKTGFRRLGLVLASPFAVVAVIMTGIALYTLATMPRPGIVVFGPDSRTFYFDEGTAYDAIAIALSKEYGRPITVGWGKTGPDNVIPTSTQMWTRNDAQHQVLTAVGAAALGTFAYAVTWALGWIIAGFAGDGEKSN